jgi:hypothetical protein
MQIKLKNALACIVNGSTRAFEGGAIVDLPSNEAMHLINTGRAIAVESVANAQGETKPQAAAVAKGRKPKG